MDLSEGWYAVNKLVESNLGPELIEQELKLNTLVEKQINDGVRQVHYSKGVQQ